MRSTLNHAILAPLRILRGQVLPARHWLCRTISCSAPLQNVSASPRERCEGHETSSRKPHQRHETADEEDADDSNMFVAKAIARTGFCARRVAVELVKAGRVRVNGSMADVLSRADPWSDTIAVDGHRLACPDSARLFLVHKPRGCITSSSDPEGRPTIFDALRKPPHAQHVVGRLDFSSEGLIASRAASHFIPPNNTLLR